MYSSEVFVDFHCTQKGHVARLRVKPTAYKDELQAKLDGTACKSVKESLGEDRFQGDLRPKQEFLGHDGHKSHYRDIPGQYLDPVERSVLTVTVTILSGAYSVTVTSDERLGRFIAPIGESQLRHHIGLSLSRSLMDLSTSRESEPVQKTESTTFQARLVHPLQAYSEQKSQLVPIT